MRKKKKKMEKNKKKKKKFTKVLIKSELKTKKKN